MWHVIETRSVSLSPDEYELGIQTQLVADSFFSWVSKWTGIGSDTSCTAHIPLLLVHTVSFSYDRYCKPTTDYHFSVGQYDSKTYPFGCSWCGPSLWLLLHYLVSPCHVIRMQHLHHWTRAQMKEEIMRGWSSDQVVEIWGWRYPKHPNGKQSWPLRCVMLGRSRLDPL